MNKRYLPCHEKECFAIGQENSISDLKEKINTCFDCYKIIDCKASQSLFKGIIKQQNAFIYLLNNGKAKK